MTLKLRSLVGRAANSTAFRAVVTTALLALVVSQIDRDLIADRLAGGNAAYGVAAVVAVAASLVLGAVRWSLLLRVGGIAIGREDVRRIYAVSAFANAFLPTSVGGDIARPLMVCRRGPVLAQAITTVLIERVIALVALLLLAWVGLVIVPGAVSLGAVITLSAASGGMAGVVLLVLFAPPVWRQRVSALVPDKIEPYLGEGARIVREFVGNRRVFLAVLVLSVAFQILVTVQIVFLGRMIGVDLPFGLAAVTLALVTLAMLVPVSIGGFGVREGSYVVVLAGGGVGHTDAVLISLLSVVALFIATLPGAFELVRRGFAPATLAVKS